MVSLLSHKPPPPLMVPGVVTLGGRNGLSLDYVAGWAACDGAGNTWASLDGRFNNMTMQGSSGLWAPSPFGVAASFDGSTHYASSVSITGIGTLVGQNSFTVSLWAMTTTPSTRQAILADWNNSGANQSLTIEIGGFGQTPTHITANNAVAYVDSGVAMVSGVWYHIAVVGDTNKSLFRIYVNGIQQNSIAYTSLNPGVAMAIGRGGAFGSLYMTGGVALPMFWSRSLGADEIQQLYVTPLIMLRDAPLPRWAGGVPGGGGSGNARNFAVIIG